jgi:tetratricopeptide (TPR) repeat protein/predicted flap endonuclease-1-like 5' DNA nuclease
MKKEDRKVANFFGKGQKNKGEKSSSLRGVIKKNKVKANPKPKLKAEVKAGFNFDSNVEDNLIEINGIGPVVAKTLNKKGIVNFSQLASIKVKELRDIIEDVRGNHEPGTWIKQAKKMSLSQAKIVKNKASLKIKTKKKSVKKVVRKVVKKNSPKSKSIGKVGKAPKKKQYKKVGLSKGKKISKKVITPIVINNGHEKGGLASIANFVLVTLFFGVGLFFTNQTFQGINFEKSIFFYLIVTIAAGLIATKFLLERNVRIRKTPFDKVLFSFVLVYGVSMWFSVDRCHSFVGFFSDPSRGFIFMIAMVVVFYLILSNFTTQTAKRALNAVVVAVVFVSIYTLVSSLGLIPPNVQLFIPFSLTGSLKSLTTLLSVGVPLLMIAYLSLGSWRYKKLAILFQGVLVVALLAISVDLMVLKIFVSWAALAGGLVAFTFLLANKNGKEIGGRFGRSIVFVMLAVFILLAGWAKSDYHNLMPISSKIGLPTEVQIGLPVSLEIIKNSVTSDWKQGLIGSGPASFGYDFAKFAPRGTVSPTPTIEYMYQGEGILAEAIPTLGAAGGLLLLLLGVILVMQLLKVLNTQSETRVYFVGLVVASIILLMNGVSSQISGGLLIFSILMLSLTVFFMLRNSKRDEEYYDINLKGITFVRFIGVLMVLAFLGASLVGGVYVVRAYLADTYFKQVLVGQGMENRNGQIMDVIRMRPGEGVYYTKLGQASLVSLGEKIKSEEEVGERETEVVKEHIVHYVETGAELMPNDVKTQRFLATIYETMGINSPEKLKGIYENIIKLDPNNIQYHIKIGDLCLLEFKEGNKNEKLDEALEWYEKALSIQPMVGVVYDRIATAYYQKGDLDQAINNVTKAIEVTPNNVSYKFTLGVLYQLKGEVEDVTIAEKIFKALLINTPRNIDILTQLGLLYEQAGRVNEAKKQYEQIISIVGGNEKLKKVSDVFKGFIENLNNGKLNIKKKNVSEPIDKKIDKVEKEDIERDNKIEEGAINDGQKEEMEITSIKPGEVTSEEVTITVGVEGAINVRSIGSLTGTKLTKIEKTGKFEKIGENEKWVQILISASDGQEELKGWVHGKFVTE